MTREEFEKTVRAMRTEGVALTMPNLMVRTELPRATIEAWLKDVDGSAASNGARSRSPARAPARTAARPGEAEAADDEEDNELGGLLDRVAGLKGELVRGATAQVVREKLGLTEDERVHGMEPAREAKDLRWGAGLGLVVGPFGLFYSAPLPVAAAASAIYLVASVILSKFGLVLPLITIYIMVHLGCAVTGAAYTWRYNRTGKRAALLPGASKKRARRR